MICENCKKQMTNDEGYETIARCHNNQCGEFMIPKRVENVSKHIPT